LRGWNVRVFDCSMTDLTSVNLFIEGPLHGSTPTRKARTPIGQFKC
jgi:hypothetical protein